MTAPPPISGTSLTPVPEASSSADLAARRESTANGFAVVMASVGGAMLYATVAAVVRDHLTGLTAVLVSVAIAAALGALTLLAARFAPQLLEAEVLHRSATAPRDELQDQIIIRALAVTGSVALLTTGLATVAVSLGDLDGGRVLPVVFAMLWVCAVTARGYIRRRY